MGGGGNREIRGGGGDSRNMGGFEKILGGGGLEKIEKWNESPEKRGFLLICSLYGCKINTESAMKLKKYFFIPHEGSDENF
jgi:hypothetical protein